VIDAYSTDSELRQYDLVTLEDDQALFPPYQGAPPFHIDLIIHFTHFFFANFSCQFIQYFC
jgi:glycine betaine/choline ABC-type transport system substrate-binding protein